MSAHGTEPRPLLITGARVLTIGQGAAPRRGADLADLGVVEHADVLVTGGLISEIGSSPSPPHGAIVIEGAGRVLMPGFVDCHTHACFAGDRYDEWERKLAGATYLELLKSGGGIMSTVHRATRAATREQLAEALLERLNRALAEGTTTIEVKSGYGLSTEHELKMLGAIGDAAARWPGTVVPTACIGHAIDADVPDFVDRTIDETLPAVAEAFPGITIDGYCEQGAWSLDDTVRLLTRARELGCPVRIHADQFTSVGMIDAAVRIGTRSVDHLEASGPSDLRHLASSDTAGVVLPACGFHLDGRYADARTFVDAGGALALATNANPGSAPTISVPAAIALGARHCGLTPAEAIVGATANGAAVLGLDDRGTVAPGQRADLILLHHTDERALAFEFGGRHAAAVIVDGRPVTTI